MCLRGDFSAFVILSLTELCRSPGSPVQFECEVPALLQKRLAEPITQRSQ
jgi:hypothetical protein